MMHASAEAEVCRKMWVAVLAQAAHDLLAPNPRGVPPSGAAAVRSAVLAWLGSRDFQKVCALAGMDGSTVAARLREAREAVLAGVEFGALIHGPLWLPPAARAPGAFAGMVCAVPGCGRRLSDENGSGVCRGHNHAVGYCRCPDCLGG